MTEKQIQNSIIREFGTRPDMRIWRANSGSARFNGQLVQFGVPGQADLTGLLPGGRRLEIEVKSFTGRQSKEQKRFQTMIEQFGGLYILARSVDAVWDALRAKGIELEGNEGLLDDLQATLQTNGMARQGTDAKNQGKT